MLQAYGKALEADYVLRNKVLYDFTSEVTQFDSSGKKLTKLSTNTHASPMKQSIAEIFRPYRYFYVLETTAVQDGRSVFQIKFQPNLKLEPLGDSTIESRALNTVMNNFKGTVYVDQATVSIVNFQAELAQGPISISLGRAYEAKMEMSQVLYQGVWLPKRLSSTYHFVKIDLPFFRNPSRTHEERTVIFSNYRPK